MIITSINYTYLDDKRYEFFNKPAGYCFFGPLNEADMIYSQVPYEKSKYEIGDTFLSA